MAAPAFQQCESHPGRPLYDHLIDVRNRLQLLSAVPNWLPVAGLFHDVGKATAYFQAYLKGEAAPPELKRHSELGALWLLEFLIKQWLPSGKADPLDIALAFLFVRRHHGRFDDLLDSLTIDRAAVERFRKQLAAMDVSGIADWLSSQLGLPVPVATVDSQKVTELRAKSWRALNAALSDSDAMARFQATLRWFGLLIECDRDSAAGIAPGYFDVPPKLTLDSVEEYRRSGNFGSPVDKRIRMAREEVFYSAVRALKRGSSSGGRLWTLTVPTGAGKTLAALGWAVEQRRARLNAGGRNCPIIYALPFTSIIDQNVKVIRQVLGQRGNSEEALAVHHHLAELGEIAEAGEESLARSWVEGWRADTVCTTFVQVVNALFHGTTADARRFSKLAGSILILDEVQAFPAELWPVISEALKCLVSGFRTDVLLVTATQPALFAANEATEIGPSQFKNDIAGAFDRYDLHVSLREPLSLDQLCEQVNEVFDVGQSCLVILNTIGEALKLHALLSTGNASSSNRLFHLSTNLRPKDRERILDGVTRLAGPRVLVSTQVVEAGIDLSFDVVFRVLAPIDAVIQAAGRCNRHGSGPRGTVRVVDVKGNSGGLIYGAVHIGLAREIFGVYDGQTLKEPQLRGLVNGYFSELNKRIGHSTATKAMEAIRRLQYAALRGEGPDSDREQKKVRLIAEQPDRVSHFVETDESDVQVWTKFCQALTVPSLLDRRRQLRKLRNEVARRVVEVPLRFAAGNEKLVHIQRAESEQHYDINTGWRRV